MHWYWYSCDAEGSRTKDHHYLFVDARQFLTIEPAQGFTPLTVDYPESHSRLKKLLDMERKRLETETGGGVQERERENMGIDKTKMSRWDDNFSIVVTGFICRTKTDGAVSTLQRDGSDYSAAIVG